MADQTTGLMQDADYKFALKYMHVYGRKVVNAIKVRINGGNGYIKSVDTGKLLKSIDYRVAFTNKTMYVDFFMGSGKINFTERPLDPATYGFFLDKGTVYIPARGFFSDEIPNYTSKDFKLAMAAEIKKDLGVWARKQLKDAFGIMK